MPPTHPTAPSQETGPVQEQDPFAFHEQFVAARSPGDRQLISGIKRLVEWVMADRDFRNGLLASPERAAELARKRGIEIDPHLVEPIWDQGFKTICPSADYEKYPAMLVWNRWVGDILRYRDLLCLAADPGDFHPRFAQWRQRIISGNNFLMGGRNKALVYPVFAYELASGCSVGCWFCAFAAKRLSGVFRHNPQNAKLWQGILQTGLDIFGPGAAQSGFCYWATEPSDNPDYLEFLKDFRDINGVICQTTTAAATRNPAWTRKMLELYEQEPRAVKPRFSVLTLDMLRQVHQTFTPEELLRVECIPQNPESFLSKARSGRAASQNQGQWLAEWRERARESQGKEKAEPEEPVTGYGNTTACVSGYLVNLVEKSIKLVTPCEAGPEWPLGYMVLAEGGFKDVGDYRAFIEKTIEEQMAPVPAEDKPLRFMPGLTLSREEDCQTLASLANVLRIRPPDHIYAQVARQIEPGGKTPSQIMAELMDQGCSPFDVTGAIDFFFKKGVLQ